MFVPFVRDIIIALGWTGAAATLDTGWVRLTISLAVLWAAAGVNLLGVALYERLMVPLMYLTFILAGVVIVAGFSFDHADFASAVLARDGRAISPLVGPRHRRACGRSSPRRRSSSRRSSASTRLRRQEVKRNPSRNLPLAIGLAVGSVGVLYMLFTAAVYHAVPWQYIADEAQRRDLTAPGLLGYLLSPFSTVIIISAAAVALAKDLPAMLLAVSRLMFAWAGDGMFPRAIASVHPVFRTPHIAILASGGMATLGILGSHLAGDFFLGVDILVSSMLVNFLLMAVSVLTLPRRNPALARSVTVVPNLRVRKHGGRARRHRVGRVSRRAHVEGSDRAGAGCTFRSTPVWAVVMAIGSLVYWFEVRGLRRAGVTISARASPRCPRNDSNGAHSLNSTDSTRKKMQP